MTPTQRTAALRLVGYIEQERINLRGWYAACRELAALLRELLAEPVQEPMAYIHTWKSHAGVIGKTLHWQATSPHGDDVAITPLFAAPPQRQPLSDDEIKALDIVLIHYGSDPRVWPLREWRNRGIGETK